MSPLAHVRAGAPRTIIFHGEVDETVPIAQSEAFCRAMTAAGNDCELRRYASEGHGFFNAGRAAFDPVLKETLRFVLAENRE
ncbi:MAG: prolyl oligopeptidase family serine peptidase [Pseudomonadales bacterium]|nr:prolyl oligopeptidase family serine peptidase [Pseudomonadales bacterium]